MEKRKNKIPKKALAFASALIIVLSLFSTIAFAQAPNFDNYTEYTLTTTIFDTDTNDVLAYVIYNNDIISSFKVGMFINSIIYSDYFYNNYYSGIFENDIDFILDLPVNSRMALVTNARVGSQNQNYAYVSDYSNDLYLDCLYDYGSIMLLSFSNYDYFYTAFENAYENQFTYWENQLNILEGEKQVAFDNGFSEGQQIGLQTGYNNGYSDGYDIGLDEGLLLGYDQGYEVGLNDGKPIGYSNGYTQAVKDMDAFERGLYDIFNAPFIFVKNISTFEIFGVNLLWILSGILLLCLGFILIKFIGGALPL